MSLRPVAGYCRCSTDKQELSIPAQKKAILEYAEETGCHVIEWFEDHGKSGTKAEGRNAFLSLIEKVESGTHGYSAILVYDIDRWGRFVDSEEATYYRVICKKHGAPVRFVVDGSMINRGDIGSQVTMTIKQVVATEESRKRSELVYERSVQNAERGYSSGGYPPYGYARMLYESDGTPIGALPWGKRKNEKSQKVGWVPDPAIAPTVVRVYDLYARQGVGAKKIASVLNQEGIPAPRGGEWGIQSIMAILDNPTYIGARVYGKTIRGAFQRIKSASSSRPDWVSQSGSHEPIIDVTTFELVKQRRQEMRELSKDRAKISSLRNGTFLLSPYLVCRECGRKFHGVSQYNGTGRLYLRYVDSSYSSHGPSSCPRFALPRDPFEKSILSALSKLVAPGLTKNGIAKAVQEEILNRVNSRSDTSSAHRGRLAEIDARLERIKKAILDGFSADDFRTEFAALQKQRQVVAVELERAMAVRPDKSRIAALADQILSLIKEFRKAISDETRIELKILIGRIVDRIEIDKVRLKAFVYFRPIPAVATGGFPQTDLCDMPGLTTSGIDLSPFIRFAAGSSMPAKYAFRDVAPGVHFGTASDRYAGWLGQIYSRDQDYKISKSKKTVKGESFTEEKLPVRSVVEFFEHYSALEIDFTFYAFLLDSEGNPSRNHLPLVEYSKWLPDDALVILKVPEAICASKHWNFEGGKRTIAENPDYLDPEKFTEQFYKPAIQILGNRIAAFSFEKGYQRKDDCPPPDDNIAQLDEFFSQVPKDHRYHIEERTDRLKTGDYFAFLHERSIGNVFSHWTWLPDLKTQWNQVEGFTNPSLSITRILTPLRVAYEESYARYHPFAELKDEIETMYRDAAFLIREGMSVGLPSITVVNNRAGGNAPEITERVKNEVLKLT